MTKSSGGTWFAEQEKKEHYWGEKREHIDLTRDENGNWYDEKGVRFDTYDMSRVPILLIRFVPYCPECMETAMSGFFNYETDPSGKGGFAFRHIWHFWYQGQQMWGWPPPVRNSLAQPGIQPADIPPTEPESIPAQQLSPNAMRSETDAFDLGRDAFKTGIKEWNNPFDGRTGVGKAWYRGWRYERHQGEEVSVIQSQA